MTYKRKEDELRQFPRKLNLLTSRILVNLFSK